MIDIAKMKQELRRDEGIRLKPYTDSVGKLTIGVGRNLTDNGISDLEADTMLLNDIFDVVNYADMAIPWYRNLSEVRQRAIINMGFNLGVNKLMDFRKMCKALRDKDYELAAEEALDSKWAKQVGKRAERIAEMFRKGE